jgi:hypothetical protein
MREHNLECLIESHPKYHDLFYSNIYFLSDNINRMKKAKTRGAHKIKRWAAKGKKKMKGGFISLIIMGLVALGVEAATAASVAAVAAPIVAGAASATAGYATTKLLNSGERRAERRTKRVEHRVERVKRRVMRRATRKSNH